MSELHPNVLTYLAAIEAFNRSDLAAIGEYVCPDFRYRIPGRSRVAGDFLGIDGFVEALTSPPGPSNSHRWSFSPTTRTSSPAPG